MKIRRIAEGMFVLVVCSSLVDCTMLSSLSRKDLLEGDPEITGIAIVACDIIANFQDRGLLEMVFGIDDNGSATGGAITGVGRIELEGMAKNNVVVFANLQPGTYKLVLMRGTRWLNANAVKKIYDCPSEWDL